MFDMSKTESLKRYSDTLITSGRSLQYLTEAVDISRENVVSLAHYIQW
jgi:hypothetical protein